MNALNDFCKIKLDTDAYGFGGDNKDTAESGVLVGLPDKFNYFGYYSFAFENSFMKREELEELYKYWESKIGKRVFWMALSEKGSILQKDDERFCFVKLTSLIAEDDADSTAHNVHGDGAGAFKA